jgi:hypothetical protein
MLQLESGYNDTEASLITLCSFLNYDLNLHCLYKNLPLKCLADNSVGISDLLSAQFFQDYYIRFSNCRWTASVV